MTGESERRSVVQIPLLLLMPICMSNIWFKLVNDYIAVHWLTGIMHLLS